MKKLNERITYARTKAGFSKAYIARSVGVSSPTVTDWESGKIKTIEAGNLLKLAQVLNVDPEWLQTGKESRNRVDAQALPVISLDDAAPEDLARIILAYEQSSELKKLALQKLSELPEDKLNAILALLG